MYISYFLPEIPKDTTVNVDIQMNEASRRKKICQKFHTRKTSPSKAANIKQTAQEEVVELLSTVPISHVILDCSTWTFIDVVAANTLKAVRFIKNGLPFYEFLRKGRNNLLSDRLSCYRISTQPV